MSLETAMQIASTGMSAQTIRLNTTASNLANAMVVSGTETQAYRARHPIFSTLMQNTETGFNDFSNQGQGVVVTGITQSEAPPVKEYQPNHELADEEGYVYKSNVNRYEELSDMLSASHDYSMSVEMMTTSRNLLLRTLSIIDN